MSLDFLEYEEQFGRLWHRLVGGRASLPRFPEAAVRLEDERLFGPRWDVLYAASSAGRRAFPWWALRRTELLALAAKSTPAYAYARDELRGACRRLRAIPAVDRWLYAMKANGNEELLRIVASEGLDLECVSAAELDLASRVVPMIRTARLGTRYRGQSGPGGLPPANSSQYRCMRRPTAGGTCRPSGCSLRPR